MPFGFASILKVYIFTMQQMGNISQIANHNNFIKMATSSFEQINRSCINNSSSKQLFSFSKEKRFQQTKRTLTSQSDYYVPSFSEARGKANRFSRSRRQLVFQNQQENKKHPSPDMYRLPETMGHSGISMAIRLKPINSQALKYPGPAAYQSQSLDRISRKVIFQGEKRQLKFPLQNQKGKDSPGPYVIQTERLKNILSNYKNPRQIKMINRTKIVDLTSFKMKLKAQQSLKSKKPANTEESIELPSSFRKSIVLKKQKTVVFDKSIRRTCFDVKDLSPGPASHQYFSEFASRNKPDTLQKSRSSLKVGVAESLKQRAKTLSVAQ